MITMHKYFITGTNTNVGKTYIAVELLKFFRDLGLTTVGLKPVAAGCELTAEGLRNADALLLQQHATCQLPYHAVNPIALAEPIAPHIAAEKQNIMLSAMGLAQHCHSILDVGSLGCHSKDEKHIAKSESNIYKPLSCCIVEGAGGWLVPLNATETMADVAKLLGFPVILVVGMELGCINHALLTYNSILATGLKVAGWVANCRQQSSNPSAAKVLLKNQSACMHALQENIASLQERIAAPLLSVVEDGGTADFSELCCIINAESNVDFN